MPNRDRELRTQPPSDEPFVVRGRVKAASGEPLADGIVRAFDCDLRHEEQLGETITDGAGRYEIRYGAEQFRRVEKSSADLVVRALDARGRELAASPILFNAGPVTTVDLVVGIQGRGSSEYERLVAEVAPLLDGVALHELTDQDLDFLAGDTGLDRKKFAWLRESAKLERGTQRASEETRARTDVTDDVGVESPLSADVFYAWLTQGLPSDAWALWSRPADALTTALRSAIDRNIVPARLRDRLEIIEEEIQRRTVAAVLQSAPKDNPPSLGDLLGTMPRPLASGAQVEVARAVSETWAGDDELLRRLQDAGLDPKQVTDVHRTLRLAELTMGNLALVKSLQKKTQGDEDVSLGSLATLERDQWLDLAFEHGAPRGVQLTGEAYARRLEEQVEALHPTAVLERRLRDGSLYIESPGFSEVGTFLHRNPDFDIASSNIETFAPRARFDSNRDAVVDALRKLQRIKSLSATWDEAGVLIDAGLGSALDVAHLGPDRLRKVVDGGIEPERADVIFKHAKAAHDTGIALMVHALPRFSPDGTAVLKPKDDAPDLSTLRDYPTLQGLFGSLDYCVCRHCRSVLSPAAYFVDLLEFLKRSPGALGALLARRPDLVDLELSCENTETKLPLMDLALEVLENAVALPLTVELPDGLDGAAALLQNPLPAAITTVLQRTTLDLGERLKAEKEPRQLLIGTMTQWTVTDRHRRWTLHHFARGFYAHRPSPLPSRKMALEGIDVEAFIKALDEGRVINDAKHQFEALLAPPAGEGRRLRPSYQVERLEAGRRWKVTYTLSAVAVVTGNDRVGRLELQTVTGDRIVEPKEYSLAGITATERALEKHAIGGVLAGHLPLNRPYVIKDLEPARGRWMIEIPPQELELQYVSERLEVAALAYQSSNQIEEDLQASPENRNPAAYDQLRAATFPWSLPFHLPLAELRAFLNRAGTSRLQLMDLCKPSERLRDDAIAREVLGLSEEEARLITEPPDRAKIWGLRLDGNNRATIRDASVDEEVTDEPLRLLSRVSILMQQARLSYAELLDVLETRYVSPADAQAVTIEPLDECQPSKMRLINPTAEHLDRIHGFVRLWRKLGWQVHEVDIALAAVRPLAANADEVLRCLSHLKRLRERLGLPIDVLASWWGRLGTHIYHAHTKEGQPEIVPLYDRVFFNPLVQQPPDPDLRLNADRTQLVPSAAGKKISEKAPLIAAALGIRQDDLAQLVAPGRVPDELTFENLSRLFRIAKLSAALNLSVREFAGLRHLRDLTPFANPAAAIEFCDAAALIRDSHFTIEELLYLLRHEVLPGSPVALSDKRATEMLAPIRAALYAKWREAGTDIRYEDLVARLANVAVVHVAELFSVSRETAHLLLRSYLRHPGDAAKYAADVLIDADFVKGNEPDPAKKAERDPAKIPLTSAKFPKQFEVIYRLHKVGMLCSRLEIGAIELAWLAAAGHAPDAMAALDLDALPVDQVVGANDLFEGWRRLVVLLRIRGRAPGAGAMLTNYVAAVTQANLPAAQAVLADALSLSADTIARAAQTLGINISDDYRNPLRLSDLLDLLITAKRLGATVEQVTALTRPSPTFEDAAVARELLRARYGAEHWRELLRPVSDMLRRQQQDALVDYLVARDRLRDANDLYEHYLIDVQMAPCMLTTRLLQGIGAVQLFVQRCLLNLEEKFGVSPDAIDRTLWEWMKSYRVWEANRKVFLYPENWLSPELRDDETQLFGELKGALSQNEPTHEHAKDALLTYLDQLNEVAQIMVLGMYEDVHDAQGAAGDVLRTLYVVGRSPNQPYRYFWRKCDSFGDARMQWSGWERVDLDISGDHVMPFVFEGDLHIASPIISKGRKDENTERWEVKLAWARRTTRGWSQKKVSRDADVLYADVLPGKDEHASFTFRVESSRVPIALPVTEDGNGRDLTIPAEQVRIHCYAAQNPQTSSRIVLRGDSKLNSPYPFAYLTVAVDALVEFGAKGSYDYARGAKVELVVNAMAPGGLRVEGTVPMFPTNNAGRSVYTFTAQNAEQAAYLKGLTYGVRVTYPPDDPSREQYRETSLDANNPGCLWCPEFVFAPAHGDAPPAAAVDPERPVDMSPLADFVLSSHADATLVVAAARPIESVDGAFAYGNGYREEANRNEPAPLRLGSAADLLAPTVFTQTPGRFFIAPATPSDSANNFTGRLWHYRDEVGRYYLHVSASAEVSRRLRLADGHPQLDVSRPSGAAGLPSLYAGHVQPSPQWTVITDGHPYAGLFRSVAGADLASLYSSRSLQTANDQGGHFALHAPTRAPRSESLKEERVSFDLRSPYAIYNWEVFLHAPLLLAEHLSKEQRFEDAQRWLHFVFDPTTNEHEPGVARFWRFVPFRSPNAGPPIKTLLEWLANPHVDTPEKAALRNQIESWKRQPFRPHAIARLRPSAYRWRVLFNYLDNLIAWGDQLFRRGTRESLNDATQLYVLAKHILGPRPRPVPPRRQAPPLTYRALAGSWDDFANAWYAFTDNPLVKAWLEHMEWLREHGGVGPQSGDHGDTRLLASIGTLYFCVPHNEKLLEYWNRVEDRLFKIRHCRDIDGVERELPLYEPPIDPELLIRATAAGVDIQTVLDDRDAPLPHYRFNLLVQQAASVCAELKSLGAAILTAMEKRDAEQLAMLRSSQEVELLKLVREVRKQQLEEARKNLDALRASRQLAADRYHQYQRLLGRTQTIIPPEGEAASLETLSLRLAPAEDQQQTLALTHSESDQLDRLIEAQMFSLFSGISSTLAGAAFIVGAIYDEPSGSVSRKSQGIGHFFNTAASALNAASGYASGFATRDALFAGYERRRDEWAFQSNLAARELQQIDKQIIAAELRVAIAQRELENHDRQTEQARTVDDFMREKYTNQALYSWMVGQLSDVYFRTYQLAYDVAKRAERAFRFEIGLRDAESDFIRFGYWNSLRSGLLAGDRLSHDLKRMELAYLDRNEREYEITKHVSLVLHAPMELVRLKANGKCTVSLPEALFDMDYPGHYMRRIKSVALTIPCVTGPYTSVNCALTLEKNRVRTTNELQALPYEEQADDKRFMHDFLRKPQSIATSHAQNDRGTFELNFRDERYLPFEGAGVISDWTIKLPKECNAFDLDTIADVILRIDYTAKGADGLRDEALKAAQAVAFPAQASLRRMFSLRHEFATEWNRFLSPPAAAGKHSIEIDLGPERFPYQLRGRSLTIEEVDLYLKFRDDTVTVNGQIKTFWELFDNSEIEVSLAPPVVIAVGAVAADGEIKRDPNLPGLPHGVVKAKGVVTSLGKWRLEIDGQKLAAADLHAALRNRVTANGITCHYLKPEVIEDLILICHYAAQ